MSTGLLVAVAVLAAAACPLHMWWQQRRGRRAACCSPRRRPEEAGGVDALADRQEELARQLALIRGARAVGDQPVVTSATGGGAIAAGRSKPK